MRVGVPTGIAVGISSFSYTNSITRGVLTGAAVALIGTVIQGAFESAAERRRQSEGALLVDAPVRPRLLLDLKCEVAKAFSVCRDALESGEIKVKRIDFDGLHMSALTKWSFYSCGARITAAAKPRADGGSRLEVSSVPRLPTVRTDLGVNYSNVFLISKFVKDRLGDDVIAERYVDMDDPHTDRYS
jgi:hypothetical protein